MIGVLAVAYDGRPTAEVDLDDSGVWVTRSSAGQLGRFNTQAQTLDGSLQITGSAFDVDQTAGNVLLDGAGTVRPVDPVRLALGREISVPSDSQVIAAADVVAVLDPEQLRLWVVPFENVGSFDPAAAEPVMEFDSRVAMTVSHEGTVFVAEAAGGVLHTIKTRGGSPHGEIVTSSLSIVADATVQITAVGDQPVVLNQSAGTLILPSGKTVAQDRELAEGVLQQPSADSTVVVAATPTGLITQPLDGSEASVSSAQGNPAAPVQLDGCVYAAWTDGGEAWRDCPGTDRDKKTSLAGLNPNAQLVYRVNRHAIVLNDVNYGMVWLAAEQFELVDDWDAVQQIDSDGDEADAETTTPDQVDLFTPDRSKPNRDPVPTDDSFGVRAGRTTVLAVLANDIDPDGDIILATPLEDASPVGAVQRILGGEALQIVVPKEAQDQATFRYGVDDGRGGHAEASVSIEVIPEDVNGEIVATGNPVLSLAQGTKGAIKVLPYFQDPENDDLVLTEATTESPGDSVEFTADGTVEFTEGETPPGRRTVNLVVSDGRGGVGKGALYIDVLPAAEVFPVPVGDHVVVQAGQPTVVTPLENDRDPAGGELRLAAVPDVAGAEITPNYVSGSLTFQALEPGSYDVLYDVTNGPATSTGVIRVDVIAPALESLPPVVVADKGLLPPGGTVLVDPLANDEDPAGGVLVIQSVQVPEDSGLVVSVLSHQMLRVSQITRPDSPVTLTYTVSNGMQSASGEVRIVPLDPPVVQRPPRAMEDEATVHTDDVVDVEVLRNDNHPDGLPLTVLSELESTVDPSMGEAFVSENKVRFRSKGQAGVVHLIYRVVDSNGQEDSAQVTIRIRGGEENDPPQPPDLEARVLAGQSVRVLVPLDGVDPDGDSTTLSQIVEQGTKGTAHVEDGVILYEAAAGSTGIDVIGYGVVDHRGQSAVGTLRVGIALPSEANQAPVAVADRVAVRPGRTVGVPVLDNDSDPDGDAFGISESLIEDPHGLNPEVRDNRIVVTAPDKEETTAFFYGIADSYGAQSLTTVTLDVSEKAPLVAPVARDDYVTVERILGEESVTVKVLENDEDLDGLASELQVTVDDPAATVTPDRSVVVALAAQPQIITYTVTDIDGLTGRAFIHVPGLRDQRPVLRPDLPPVKVVSGEPFTVEIAEYVLVREGRTPTLTGEDGVKAVKGVRQVKDADTIDYTSELGYTGPASLSFEVTDGDSPQDPEGAIATVVLPLEVVPADNQPPTLKPVALDVAVGESAGIDLDKFAVDPDGDLLKITVDDPPKGLDVTARGTAIEFTASPDLPKGTVHTVAVTVADSKNPPVPGTVTVTIVGTRMPLPVANQDTVPEAAQGVASTVDVIANDINPFPDTPLKIVGTPVIETGRGAISMKGGKVVVTPDESFNGIMVARYTIEDATGDRDRRVDGTVHLTVQGTPDMPTTPQIVEVRSKTVVLSWTPPNNNGAEITEYLLTPNDGRSTSCSTTTCTVEGLKNDVEYTFTVTAVNKVGTSVPSAASASARPDERPDPPEAPVLSFGDQSLDVTWKNARYDDRSPVTCVYLEISPAVAGESRTPCLTGTSYQWPKLTNGTGYRIRSIATNAADKPSEPGAWSIAEVPAGKPDAPAAPSVARTALGTQSQITVSWNAPADHGATITAYTVEVRQGGNVVQTASATGSARSAVLNVAADTQNYTFRVRAHNRASDKFGDAEFSPLSDPVRAFAPPGAVTNLRADPTGASGQLQLSFGEAPTTGVLGEELSYQYDAGTGWRSLDASRLVTGLQDGQTYQIAVRAVANVQGQSAAGASSSAPAQRPYGPPRAPIVTGANGGQGQPFGVATWSDPGSAGLSYRTQLRTDGGPWHEAPNSGSQNVGNGWNVTHNFCARTLDELNREAISCVDVSSGSQPAPTVQLRKGNQTVNLEGCGNSCWYLHVTVEGATPNMDFTVECLSTKSPVDGFAPPQTLTRANVRIRTDGAGNFSGEMHCGFGSWSGTNSVWVRTPFGESSQQPW